MKLSNDYHGDSQAKISAFESEPVIVPYVLLVDNQPENLLSMEAVLGDSQLQIVTAKSGEEALRAVLEYDFALILMDVQMPRMNGFETAELIWQRKRSQDTPIIFVTAINKDAEHVFHGYSIGAVDYVFKPYPPEILKSKVEVFVSMYARTAELRFVKRRLEIANQGLELFSLGVLSDLRAALHSSEPALDRSRPTIDSGGAMQEVLALLANFFDAANLVLNPEPFAASQACQAAIDVLPATSQLAAVQWRVADLPVVYGSRQAIKIVFYHLMVTMLELAKNTRQPTFEVGGYVTQTNTNVLYIREQHFDGLAPTNQTLQQLFQAVEPSPLYHGMGIRLSIAQNLIGRHGGQVWGAITADHGAMFCFSLPQTTGLSAQKKGEYDED